MQRSRFLPAVLFFTAAFGGFSFAACGGNVVLDGGNTSTSTGGSGGASGSAGQGGNTVNPVGGSTGDAGSVGVGGSTIEPGCPPGYSLCGDICTDTSSDPANCGFCGNWCGNGASCVQGNCVIQSCVGCAEYISGGGDICPGQSTDIYNTMAECICAGKCIAQCATNVCNGSDITAECQTCVTDTVNGCGNEFNECANDL